MATAKIKMVLPGLTGYGAGDLRLAMWLHSAAQDAAAVASNLSLTPDASQADTYWTTVAGFAGLCRAMVTEGSTIRASGYVLMDDTDGVHVVVGSPGVASIDGTAYFITMTAAVANMLADYIRRRTQQNVEASANGDALDKDSLYGLIQQICNSSIAEGVWTINKTDGTPLGTREATSDAGADPIIGVS